MFYYSEFEILILRLSGKIGQPKLLSPKCLFLD